MHIETSSMFFCFVFKLNAHRGIVDVFRSNAQRDIFDVLRLNAHRDIVDVDRLNAHRDIVDVFRLNAHRESVAREYSPRWTANRWGVTVITHGWVTATC